MSDSATLAFGGLGAIGAFGLNNPAGLSKGLLSIQGPGTSLSVGGISNSQFWVGNDGGTGSLYLANQARLSVEAFNNPGGFGDARLYVGRNGIGDVTIRDGAELVVQDRGGWGADDDVMVGLGGNQFAGEGRLQVMLGGRMQLRGNSAYLNVGRANTSNTGSLPGSGFATVESGGLIVIDGRNGEAGLHIARGDNSHGSLIIQGASSRVEMRGRYTTAWIGSDWSALTRLGTGQAELIVRDHGVLSLSSDPVPAGSLRTDMLIGFGLGHAEVKVESGGRVEMANGLRISSNGSTGEHRQFGRLSIGEDAVVSVGSFTYIGDGDSGRTSGVLTGTGTLISPRVELFEGGMIAPGNSPGTLRIQGNLTISGGLLELELAGAGPARHDLLWVDGQAMLKGGHIQLAFVDGYLPQAGDSIELIHADTISGLSFAQFSIVGLAAGFRYAIDLSGGGLVLNALNDAQAVPEPHTWALWLTGLTCLTVLRRSVPRASARPRERA